MGWCPTLTAVNTADNSVIGTVKSGPKGALKGSVRRSASARTRRPRGRNDDLTVAEIDVDSLEVTDILGD